MSAIDYQSIMPEGWSRARGFSWGVVADGSRVLRIAGQVGGERGDLPVKAGSDFGDQWERALGNLVEILRAAGGEPGHVVMLRAYVTDLDAFNASGAAVGAAWGAAQMGHLLGAGKRQLMRPGNSPAQHPLPDKDTGWVLL